MTEFGAFTRHIQVYRLFGQLTTFRVNCQELRIGQIMHPTSFSNEVGRDGKAALLVGEDGKPPGRYKNDLLPLKDLVYLEEFVMDVHELRGVISIDDFEFLQRKEDDFGDRLFPSPPPPHRRIAGGRRMYCTIDLEGELGETSKNNDNSSGDGQKEGEYDSEDENDFGEVKAYKDVKTFWPRLTAFQVNYLKTSNANDLHALVEELKWVRPGVDFRFRLSPNIGRCFY